MWIESIIPCLNPRGYARASVSTLTWMNHRGVELTHLYSLSFPPYKADEANTIYGGPGPDVSFFPSPLPVDRIVPHNTRYRKYIDILNLN